VIVVSDTSPILNLSTVGHLHLLRRLSAAIVLPPSVAAELGGHRIETKPSRMRVVAAQDREQLAELRRQLDPGEAEAIIVAIELWRICFEWPNGSPGPRNVEIVDYH